MNILLIVCQFLLQSSFYNLTLPSNAGGTIDFASLKGKKVMLVNIASGVTQENQLKELDSLAAQFVNDLVIIAVPSNSFGNEPLDDSTIGQRLKNRFAHVLLAAKVNVNGEYTHEVYTWVADKGRNGRASFIITSDFQKVLVDESGLLIGHFSAEVNPLSELIASLIR